jgi:hypothetical protein
MEKQKRKLKKVIKGLSKASKTHAKQAKTLKSVLNNGSMRKIKKT